MNNLQLIKKVLHHIDEHLGEELTYESLAGAFGYSAFHFHKLFSSVTEMSVTEYIRKRRLTMAHHRLCHTAETVAGICYDVGFGSIQTFNRAFKDTFGMQPLVAREKKASITYRSVEEIIEGMVSVCRWKVILPSNPDLSKGKPSSSAATAGIRRMASR